jgi:hypothetical protein
METIKSKVVNSLDQEFLAAIREMIVTETKKIVQQETRKIVKEETRKIVQQETRKIVQQETRKIVQQETRKIVKEETAKIGAQVEENTRILRALEANKDIQNARMDRMEHDLAELRGNNKKIKNLEDKYIHHSHRIVIDTSEAIERVVS